MSRRSILWAIRAAVIWLCATVALSSAAVHSGTALRAFVTPHFSGAVIFLAAFFTALLIGLALESPRWAVALTVAMCLVTSAIYGGVIYAPVWLDISITTIAFQNYVSQQVLLLLLWCSIPALTGALIGCFAGAGLRPSRHAPSASSATWERSTPPDA